MAETMKGQVVLETLKNSKALSKAHKQIFSAFAEDNERMEERMVNLEKKVDSILAEQIEMKTAIADQSKSIDRLIKVFEEKKAEKLTTKEIFMSLVNKTGFWVVLILLISLIFGAQVTDLGSFLKVGL